MRAGSRQTACISWTYAFLYWANIVPATCLDSGSRVTVRRSPLALIAEQQQQIDLEEREIDTSLSLLEHGKESVAHRASKTSVASATMENKAAKAAKKAGNQKVTKIESSVEASNTNSSSSSMSIGSGWSWRHPFARSTSHVKDSSSWSWQALFGKAPSKSHDSGKSQTKLQEFSNSTAPPKTNLAVEKGAIAAASNLSSAPEAHGQGAIAAIALLARQSPLSEENIAKVKVSLPWYEVLLVGMLYVLGVIIAAYCYGTCFTYSYPPPRLMPSRAAQDTFTFNLFDGLRCDPDWRICCCSCFCMPIRWADTVGSDRIRMMTFWQALILFATLQALAGVTVIGSILLVALGVVARQRIRKSYMLPEATPHTMGWDILAWLCCMPCAIMQEALQIEFVDTDDASKEPLMPPKQDDSIALAPEVV